jgi:hypothetical protein
MAAAPSVVDDSERVRVSVAAELLGERVRFLGLIPNRDADAVAETIGKLGVFVGVLVAEGHLNREGRSMNHFEPQGQ